MKNFEWKEEEDEVKIVFEQEGEKSVIFVYGGNCGFYYEVRYAIAFNETHLC